MPPACAANSRERPSSTIAMARMRRACLASTVRAASARNCEILKSWCVISIADMLPAPRINDMLHRVTVAVVWESPQESGSQAAGIRLEAPLQSLNRGMAGPKPGHCLACAVSLKSEIIAVPGDKTLNSFFQLRFRGKTSESQKQRRVGEGDWNIALLHRHEIALGAQSGRGLDGGDEIHERNRCLGADVDDSPGRDGRKAVFGPGRRAHLRQGRCVV